MIDVDAEVVNAAIFKTCGWSKRSIFWDLPYWREHLPGTILMLCI